MLCRAGGRGPDRGILYTAVELRAVGLYAFLYASPPCLSLKQLLWWLVRATPSPAHTSFNRTPHTRHVRAACAQHGAQPQVDAGTHYSPSPIMIQRPDAHATVAATAHGHATARRMESTNNPRTPRAETALCNVRAHTTGHMARDDDSIVSRGGVDYARRACERAHGGYDVRRFVRLH